MSEVAIAGDDAGVYDAGKEGRVVVRHDETQEEVSCSGQDNETHGKGNAVNGEAAQPFLEVVSFRAEDEVLIAEEGDSNADGRGDDERHVSEEGLAAVRHEVAKQDDEAGVNRQ